MYSIKDSKPIVLKKGKIEITLDLGIGAYNPDESKRLFPNDRFSIGAKPWLKYEGKWYFIKTSWKFNSLETLADFFKRDCYSEEIFLERIMESI